MVIYEEPKKKDSCKITVNIGRKNKKLFDKYIKKRGQTLTSAIRILIEKAVYSES